MPHLLLSITAHGYGHLAQSSPVVEALTRRLPGLKVTLQGNIDPLFARRRLPPGFAHLPRAADVGLLMDGPLQTRWTDSLAEYARFDNEYERHLERQIELLSEHRPDLVVADVPWLPLDAARRLGIPAVGLCSLTWYDILNASPVSGAVPADLMARMRSVYAAADLFIRPAPSMPMTWLPNARDVGPIARVCPDRGLELRERLGIPAGRPMVLVQFGGFSGFETLLDWPRQDRFQWLVPDPIGRARADTSVLADHGLGVLDVLGSCDLMVAKPGYGTFTEAACNGVPVLYVARGDWPEEPYLLPWLAEWVPMQEIPIEDLRAGRLAGPLGELMAAGRPRALEPTGIEEAADLLAPWLGSGRA